MPRYEKGTGKSPVPFLYLLAEYSSAGAAAYSL